MIIEAAMRFQFSIFMLSLLLGGRGSAQDGSAKPLRVGDPAPDFARIAQGFGVHAEGPLDSAEALGPALRRALRVVKDEGRPALVDVITR